MFESTLSAQGLSASNRRLGPLSVAIIGHLAIVSAIVGITAMIVPPLAPKNPPESHVLVTVLQPPDLGLERPRPGEPKKGADASRPKPSVTPQAPIQPPAPPLETPEALPTPSEVPAPDGPDGSGSGSSGLTDGTGSGSGENLGGGEGGPIGGEAGPVFISAEMVRPGLLVKVEPAYPNVARIARLGGRVTVKAVIGLDGSVESAEISSSSSPLFNDAARDAVLKWRYRPALMNGKPVRVYFTVVVEFSIR